MLETEYGQTSAETGCAVVCIPLCRAICARVAADVRLERTRDSEGACTAQGSCVWLYISLSARAERTKRRRESDVPVARRERECATRPGLAVVHTVSETAIREAPGP